MRTQAHTFLKLLINMLTAVPQIVRQHVDQHVDEIDLHVDEFVNRFLKLLIFHGSGTARVKVSINPFLPSWDSKNQRFTNKTAHILNINTTLNP